MRDDGGVSVGCFKSRDSIRRMRGDDEDEDEEDYGDGGDDSSSESGGDLERDSFMDFSGEPRKTSRSPKRKRNQRAKKRRDNERI